MEKVKGPNKEKAVGGPSSTSGDHDPIVCDDGPADDEDGPAKCDDDPADCGNDPEKYDEGPAEELALGRLELLPTTWPMGTGSKGGMPSSSSSTRCVERPPAREDGPAVCEDEPAVCEDELEVWGMGIMP